MKQEIMKGEFIDGHTLGEYVARLIEKRLTHTEDFKNLCQFYGLEKLEREYEKWKTEKRK